MIAAGCNTTDLTVARFVAVPPAGLEAAAANDSTPLPTPHMARFTKMPRALPGAAPLSSYRGVAARVRQADGQPLFELTLLHADPAQSVPLTASCEAAAVAREWRAWGEALSLPLIAMDADGAVHGELNPLGPITAERPSPRRKGSALVGRRSRFGRRRRAMQVPAIDAMPMRESEREIIARN